MENKRTSCLFAVARLTVIESVRKRVFLAFAAFGAALVVMSALLPSLDPASQVVLLQAWAYRLALLFGVMVAIVLAAFSVPEDVEERRIQVLLSKPVRRTDVLLGKFFGFLGVTAVFLFVVGVFSIATVRVAAALVGPAADPALAPDTLEPAAAFEAGPAARPVSYGSRADVYQDVRGPLDRCLSWRFEGVTRDRYGPTVRGKMRIRLGAVETDPGLAVDATNLVLEIVRLDPAGAPVGSAASHPLRPWHNRWETFAFPIRDAEPEGRVLIRLRRAREDTWVAGTRDSLELTRDGGALAFEWNFAKALALVFLQIAMLLSQTLAVSLFASALVSLLTGGFLFFCWSLIGFLRGALVMSTRVLEEAQKHPGRRAQPGDLPPWLVSVANDVTGWLLAVFPDLSQLDYSGHLVSGTSVPFGMLFTPRDLLLYAAWLFAPMLLACVIARRKEFV